MKQKKKKVEQTNEIKGESGEMIEKFISTDESIINDLKTKLIYGENENTIIKEEKNENKKENKKESKKDKKEGQKNSGDKNQNKKSKKKKE